MILQGSIDTETTGLVAGVNEMVSLAVVIYEELTDGSNHPVYEFKSIIRPMHPELIDPKALEVNGYTREELAVAPTPMQVRSIFFSWWVEVLGSSVIFPLGHNFAFDQSFMKVFFGHQYENIFHYKFRDTFILAQALKDAGRLDVEGGLKLVHLAKHFGIEFNPHRAYDDAIATMKIYAKLVAMLK